MTYDREYIGIDFDEELNPLSDADKSDLITHFKIFDGSAEIPISAISEIRFGDASGGSQDWIDLVFSDDFDQTVLSNQISIEYDGNGPLASDVGPTPAFTKSLYIESDSSGGSNPAV